jgi:ankyrin repeat protein
MKMLLDIDADIDAKADNSFTALHLAAKHKQPAAIALLIEYGCDIDAYTDGGFQALHIASKCDDRAVAGSMVQLLLNAGAAVDTLSEAEGATPLYAACRYGCLEAVLLLLLRRGADANAAVANRTSCLMCAADRGQAEMVLALLVAGARFTAKDWEGSTALHHAVKYPADADDVQSALATLLAAMCARRASVSDLDRRRRTPLHIACIHGNASSVGRLLRAGARMEDRDYAGKLSWAKRSVL